MLASVGRRIFPASMIYLVIICHTFICLCLYVGALRYAYRYVCVYILTQNLERSAVPQVEDIKMACASQPNPGNEIYYVGFLRRSFVFRIVLHTRLRPAYFPAKSFNE